MGSFFQDFVYRMGARLAKSQINQADLWGPDPIEFSREANNSFWKARSIDMSFENGYHAAWADKGASDVHSGKCRAVDFRNHGYNLGWRGEFQQLYVKGWRSIRLKTEAELMEKHYWSNISCGKSHEYYDIMEKCNVRS